MTKKIRILSFLFFLLIIIWPIKAQAFIWQTTDSLYVAAEETIDGNLYFSNQNVKIDGTINGDLIGLAQNLEVNGRIEGDILTISRTINFNGEVVGNIRALGDTINLNGIIGRNLNLLGLTVFLGPEGKIGQDVLLAAHEINFHSSVVGNLYGRADSLILNGKIGKTVSLILNDQKKGAQGLRIGDEAIIKGHLTYRSSEKANISSGAEILGQTEQKKPIKESFSFLKEAWKFLYSIFSSLLIGLILIHFFKKPLNSIFELMLKKSAPSLAWGIGWLFLFPLLIILLLFTLIGVPLALMLAGLWLVLFFVSRVITAIFIGRQLISKFFPRKKINPFWEMTLGVSISWLFFSLPFLGTSFSFLAIVWAAGGFCLYLRQRA